MAGPAVELASKCLWDAGPLSLQTTYIEKYRGIDKDTGKPRPPAPMWRLQAAAGDHKSGGDPHIAGRALDVILRVAFPDEKADADKICAIVAELRAQMGLIAIIYNHQEWPESGPVHPRAGANDAINQHETHIHLEWGTQIMREDFGDLFRSRLYPVFRV